jgi:hypothetical protein
VLLDDVMGDSLAEMLVCKPKGLECGWTWIKKSRMMAVLATKGSNEITWMCAVRIIGGDGLLAVFGFCSVEWELHVR